MRVQYRAAQKAQAGLLRPPVHADGIRAQAIVLPKGY